MLKPLKYSPYFSTGPCKKHNGYSLLNLQKSLLGRSHRSNVANDLLLNIIKLFKEILEIPNDYKLILTPASDSGAFEMALWNLLGSKTVDCLHWDYFGDKWFNDIKNQLKIKNINEFKAPYGFLPDLKGVDYQNNDVVFTYCGTTSGVIFNEIDKIPNDRNGLIISDGTSYVFSEKIQWNKIDALTFSWQKALGGEAQNGILILSPRAIERINNYTPPWAIPSIFNIKANNKINDNLLDTGVPINTVSMLCMIDMIEILEYFKKQGGINHIIQKVNENSNAIAKWLNITDHFELIPSKEISSKMSICLKIKNPKYLALNPQEQRDFLYKMHNFFENKKIAYDIKSHKSAPDGIRIWTGPTINKSHIKYLCYRLDKYFSKNLK